MWCKSVVSSHIPMRLPTSSVHQVKDISQAAKEVLFAVLVIELDQGPILFDGLGCHPNFPLLWSGVFVKKN